MAQRAIRILIFVKTLPQKVKKKMAIFFFFQVSIHFHPLILSFTQKIIASVLFNGHWQQNYSIILWFSLMQELLLVF